MPAAPPAFERMGTVPAKGPVDGQCTVRHDSAMTDNDRSHLYVWFDMEFTDLDPAKADILQVALLVTDAHLRLLQPDDRGLNLYLKLEADATISEWVEQNLGALLEVCRSDRAIDSQSAKQRLADYLDRVVGTASPDIQLRPVMAGNSVHNDWRLASIHYPDLIQRLHYRLMDVTALKLQWQDWLGQPEFDKENAELVREFLPFDMGDLEGRPHDAFYDILASIAELNFYRTKMLKPV